MKWFIDYLAEYERAGEEPRLSFTSAQLERFGGSPGDGSTSTIDVKRAVEQLRARGELVTAESVSRALCPFSADGEGEQR